MRQREARKPSNGICYESLYSIGPGIFYREMTGAIKPKVRKYGRGIEN